MYLFQHDWAFSSVTPNMINQSCNFKTLHFYADDDELFTAVDQLSFKPLNPCRKPLLLSGTHYVI